MNFSRNHSQGVEFLLVRYPWRKNGPNPKCASQKHLDYGDIGGGDCNNPRRNGNQLDGERNPQIRACYIRDRTVAPFDQYDLSSANAAWA